MWIVLVFVFFVVGLLFVRNSIIGKLLFCWLVVFVRCLRVRRSVLLMLVLFFVIILLLINIFLFLIFLLVVNDVEFFYSSVLLLNRIILKELFLWSWFRMVIIVWWVCVIFSLFIELLMLMIKMIFLVIGLRLFGEKYCMK